MTFDTVITESHVMLPGGMTDRNIIIDDGRIAGLTTSVPACDTKIDGTGMVSIPGPIDTHVHYGVYSPIDEDGQDRIARRGHWRSDHHDAHAATWVSPSLRGYSPSWTRRLGPTTSTTPYTLPYSRRTRYARWTTASPRASPPSRYT